MQKIAVLGAGMVGSAIALDLALQFDVTSIDLSLKNLTDVKLKNDRINILQKDLGRTLLFYDLLAPFDFIVSAVPGFLGFEILKKIIEAKKNVVDISFFPEDALDLDILAKEHNVTAIVDCGVAPGMSNLILGYENEQMKLDSFECYVGGLPVERKKPYEYKAPFSPIDVIEEYTRPARIYENREVVTKPALSEIEPKIFPVIGELEAFNSDGLRSLLFTMDHIPNLKEKTLRYPGHANQMKEFRDAGKFEPDQLEQTLAELFEAWKLEPNDDEFTLMQITLKGENKIVSYDLLAYRDKASGVSSMSRTTGYAATGAIHLLAKGLFTKQGVFPPELVGKDTPCFEYMLTHLKERGIDYKKSES